jgi:bacterioferritin
MSKNNHKKILDCLSKIFQAEMAGIVRYLHYSFMIMGHNRIPIQKWFRDQASESTAHTIAIGEWITSYGGHPPVLAAKMEESNKHGVDQILNESLVFEEESLRLYRELVKIAAESDDIALEEFARGQIMEETQHVFEVQKMLRKS